MTFRARTDANQADIKRVVETVGKTFQSIASVGKGCPDGLVGGLFPCPSCGHMFEQNKIWEIKNGLLVPSARKLTRDERRWHEWWGGQVAIIESPEDALDDMGVRPRAQRKDDGS